MRRFLAHPLTRGLDIDDPSTTALRRTIIESKPFLKRIYEEWSETISNQLPDIPGPVLELGSGAGFLNSYIPRLITSEVFSCPGIQVVLDGQSLPIAGESLRSIVMIDVLHHIPDARRFFQEADRCLMAGGRILLIEPWVSKWSRFIYTHLHHEPFLPDSTDWSIPLKGPLSGANGALPWIIFERDREQFAASFPQLKVELIRPFMPFRYLVSGGVSLRTLMPGAMFPFWKSLESAMANHMRTWAMFALIVISKPEQGEAKRI
ncbi:MAG: class I SAM-dependent methyltransferase [Acidobacteriota bacterium]|nr:class I SAM-dependent methyltransferase [Acidobacteriota bacterium]